MFAGIGATAFSDNENSTLIVEPSVLDTTGIRTLQQEHPDLNGAGVVIASVCRSMTYLNGRPQNDYRFNMHHSSLSDADILFEDHSDGSYGISPHATAIAGILIGLDPQALLPDGSTVNYQGVCPYAAVDVYEFWRFVALRLFARKPTPADIITLSLGDIFEDWWTRGIEQLADEKGTVIVAAIGNGQDVRDPALYPAAGANVIGVGVIDSVLDETGELSLTQFGVPTARHSSRGPTDDMRSKPDLVAPGSSLVPEAYTENGYTTLTNASSLAAPVVAGTAALLLQKAYQDAALLTALEDTPVNCVIKAVLMNSARKLPYWHKGDVIENDDPTTPLDRLQGAGALDAQAAIAQLVAGKFAPGDIPAVGWDSRSITSDDTFFYMLESSDPNVMLTATLTWNRHFEDHYPFRLRSEQSDLRLELWAVNSDNPAEMILLDVSDSPVDTVEHLWIPLPSLYTRFILAIRYSPDASLDTSTAAERFALAWSIGVDSSIGHPFWNDLNGDGKIEQMDSIIQILLDSSRLQTLPADFNEKILNLSSERIELLTTLRHRWKPYLNPIIDK